jgi:hypothetical protein
MADDRLERVLRLKLELRLKVELRLGLGRVIEGRELGRETDGRDALCRENDGRDTLCREKEGRDALGLETEGRDTLGLDTDRELWLLERVLLRLELLRDNRPSTDEAINSASVTTSAVAGAPRSFLFATANIVSLLSPAVLSGQPDSPPDITAGLRHARETERDRTIRRNQTAALP